MNSRLSKLVIGSREEVDRGMVACHQLNHRTCPSTLTKESVDCSICALDTLSKFNSVLGELDEIL